MNAPRPSGDRRPADAPRGRELSGLALAALGVVFGDIGTSPIYAIRESLGKSYGLEPSPANVFGVLSLIFWALLIVISFKYLTLVMRADNRGEGGMIALTALVAPPSERLRGHRRWLVMAGLFGAALLYGDGMITPAISVLSAIEGLEVATPVFRPYVIPITIGILVALFAIQSRGTARVGSVFGPLTLVWFTALAALGVSEIVRNPEVLGAVSPLHAVDFFARNRWAGFLVLGSVFLVVTGGEALYADMGHFGTRPIRLTWFAIVLPGLLLNYFGQGALILREPEAVVHPFFHMGPRWALYPLVVLATVATVIASQAVISGAFSLTRQAVRLGYLPRMKILHTSKSRIGQIYVPAINWVLMLACVGLVLGFRTSSHLAAAYGVAVTTDMVFTTILFAVVARTLWKWSRWVTGLMVAALLAVDLSFWAAMLTKIPHGGWFPIVVALCLFTLMTTWKVGRRLLSDRLVSSVLPIDMLLAEISSSSITRVPGTAVFMSSSAEGTPPALLHNLKHNKVIHERVVLLTIVTVEVPRIPDGERVRVETLGREAFRVTAHYGFTEDPDVPAVLALCAAEGLEFKMTETTFFLGRETLIPSEKPGMALWREKLFAIMSRNSLQATSFFHIPPNRVVELGTQIEI